MTRQEFEDKLVNMKPGEKLVYYTGHIMFDRQRGYEFGKVNNLAHAAFMAYEAGKVYITQRRVKAEPERNLPDVFQYIAVKKAPPFKEVKWTGCYDPERTSLRTVASRSPATA